MSTDLRPNVSRDEALKLTEDDEQRHIALIARVQERLFRKYTLEQYFILPNSMGIERPIVSFNGGRHLSLGGVTYEVAIPRCDRVVIAIRHMDGSRFNFFMTMSVGTQTFTRLATTSEFKDLDRHVLDCIQFIHREESNATDIGLNNA